MQIGGSRTAIYTTTRNMALDVEKLIESMKNNNNNA